MKSVSFFILLAFSLASPILFSGPREDLQQFREHFRDRFPNLKPADFADGVYAIDEDARSSWQAIEEFPPYEPSIESGEKLFNKPFRNGGRYKDCFSNQGIGIAQTYPKWDKHTTEVVTLALALNKCREENNEPSLPYKKGEIAQLLAYMALTSRGKAITIEIPQDPNALAAYEQGKGFYYQRRGQLNFSCATCHIQNAGKRIRSETLSPSLGHTSGWPAYRLKWGEMGTLHRRFIGCSKQIRATPFEPQSKEYRNLEYFMSYMNNGIPINGPSTRK